MYSDLIIAKAKPIKILICDVDGVLTNGSLYYDDKGIAQMAFHVHDGVGLNLLKAAGIQVGIITSSPSPIIATRMRDLSITHLYQGQAHKVAAFESLLLKQNLTPNEAAYIGDDVPDLPLMKRCGLSIAVKNANEQLLRAADFTTQKSGGQGAVREVCDLLLHAQGLLGSILSRFDEP